MRIIIIGMGAVGGVIAGYLLKNGIETVGIVSNKHFFKFKQDGFHFIDINSNEYIFKENADFKILPSLKDTTKLTGFTADDIEKDYQDVFSALTSDDWIIITSKAYSLPEICKQYGKYIEGHGEILLIQNGIGNEEIVKKYLPNVLIYRGTTTNGALLLGSGWVKHTGIGNIKLGIPTINEKNEKKETDEKEEREEKDEKDEKRPNVSGNLPNNSEVKTTEQMKENLLKLKSVLDECGFNTEYSEHIDQILWEKIMINIGINAPATIRNIPNGDLLKDTDVLAEMSEAITEAWRVGKALGVLSDENADKYIQITKEVASKTAQNRNSMLQDIENNKPTEILFINGKIVDYGKELGIPTPVNEKLTELIIKLEKQKTGQ